MAFEKVAEHRGSKHKPDRVAMIITGKAGKKPLLVTHFGANVVAQLGWKSGDRCVLLVGTGKDAGKIQFLRNPSGNILRPLGAVRSKNLSLSFSVWNGIPNTKQPTAAVSWRARPSIDGIEVDLPDWNLPALEAAE